jgi:hypothetical protein
MWPCVCPAHFGACARVWPWSIGVVRPVQTNRRTRGRVCEWCTGQQPLCRPKSRTRVAVSVPAALPLRVRPRRLRGPWRGTAVRLCSRHVFSRARPRPQSLWSHPELVVVEAVRPADLLQYHGSLTVQVIHARVLCSTRTSLRLHCTSPAVTCPAARILSVSCCTACLLERSRYSASA